MSSRRCLDSRTERALLMIRRFSLFFLALLVWAASRGPDTLRPSRLIPKIQE